MEARFDAFSGAGGHPKSNDAVKKNSRSEALQAGDRSSVAGVSDLELWMQTERDVLSYDL